MNYYSESCVSFEFQEIAEGKTLYINNSNNLTIPSNIFQIPDSLHYAAKEI